MIQKVALGEPKMWMNTLGDCWETVWAEDNYLYSVSDDTMPVSNEPISAKNTRDSTNLMVHRFSGDSIQELKGITINNMNEYGAKSAIVPDGCSDGCCWKAMGITSVDNVLYVAVGRHDYGDSSEDPWLRQTSRNASIIKSADRGKTWWRNADNCYRSPMFMGGKFGTPYFIHYGKAGTESVHNADRYVYAISNNGFWDNGDKIRLGRVLKSEIGRLNAFDWAFYKGGDGMKDESWSYNINDTIIGDLNISDWELYKDGDEMKEKVQSTRNGYLLEAPGKCSMTGAQYIEGLERYIMIQWYYTSGGGVFEEGAKKLGLKNPGQETIWDFYESPYPWGPWRLFDSHTFNPLGAYNPCIVPKLTSDDGMEFVVFTNGNFYTAFSEGTKCVQRVHFIECKLEMTV